MERILRREIEVIARDHQGGATAIALRAASALEAWSRRERDPAEAELLEIAEALLRAQPSMAPLLRLANEVAHAVDAPDPRAQLAAVSRRFRSELRSAADRIAAKFYRWIRRRGEKEIVYTYSYSSTVAKALLRARSRIESVCCSESRPGNEGLLMALRLSRGGIKTEFFSDAGLFSQTFSGVVAVLGADAVLPGWIACKAGSRVLIHETRRARGTVVLLADTTKFWPERSRKPPRWDWTFGPEEDLWKNPPRRVSVYNLYFELVRHSPRILLLTERGWMSPRQVKRALDTIEVSPRLREIAAERGSSAND
ncbi:MAG: hypothetical protein ACRD50_11450 [Candidatus Acidiferrales bacterium]